MSLGPVEYMVIEFPGNQFKGEIIPALREVVDKGVIRIIDLVFVRKDEQGNVSVMELSDLQKDAASAFAPLARDTTTLLAEDDIRKVSDIIEKNSSAALFLFEHLWAKKFRDAVLNAHGEVIAGERIKKEKVDAALAWRPGELEAAGGSRAS
ncbi:hypothetical protein BN140_0703 [Methanoculleus bourgensis MS2]|uniref:DUF1269 domain-containing protein n=1 Tax=Methanoculleus bourgensis (strain ATCC 43281 / DSM 3045 / OCM 15 / MS2) TaxID=1201294 RepID=I7KBT7_METBM|nr:DUF6325 family protein [Methanoculleus bourgensis]CCJ35626.1 hypothetical protein BN140_0703 [Methanoculleus bourgensis MS2]